MTSLSDGDVVLSSVLTEVPEVFRKTP
jgi:hypothetical protein